MDLGSRRPGRRHTAGISEWVVVEVTESRFPKANIVSAGCTWELSEGLLNYAGARVPPRKTSI